MSREEKPLLVTSPATVRTSTRRANNGPSPSVEVYGEFADSLSSPILVDIVELVLAGGARSQLDHDYILELARDRGPLPPIIVHGPTKRVVDGVHRVRAAMLRGGHHVAAQMFFGDESELFTLAVAANIAHGHPLQKADRKRAASDLLAAHPDWSTRRVAAACGLAPGTVTNLRGPVSPAEVRIGRNGHRRAVDSREPRKLASEVLAAEPGISLRQAARKARVSPTTVRDIRDRIRTVDGWPTSPVNASAEQTAPPRSTVRPLLDQLRADPSLRHTIVGRRLLAGLSAGTLDGCDLVQLARTLPTHCVELVATAAADCSRAWQELADAIHLQAGNRHHANVTTPHHQGRPTAPRQPRQPEQHTNAAVAPYDNRDRTV